MARTESLTRDWIVGAAVEVLDAAGHHGLTFRALGARLRTGPGAIYHHVANKDELLAAATDGVLAAAIPAEADGVTPGDRIRAVALAVFDAIDEHPWVGTQIAHASSQPAVLRLFDHLGQQVQALGVPEAAQFDAASTLLLHIFGVAAQNAALARSVEPGTDRGAFLEAVLPADPTGHPFLTAMATQLREHDDRRQFLAGVDIILTGITHHAPAQDAPVRRP